MADSYDLAVIGGGSGGLACAQRAAEYGARVILIEPARLGGTCVNVGCMPKKIMWNAAGFAEELRDAREYGFEVAAAEHDWGLLKRKRDAYIVRLNQIYERNLANRKVEVLRARARLIGRAARSRPAGARSRRSTSSLQRVAGRWSRQFPARSSASPPMDSSSWRHARSAWQSWAAATSPWSSRECSLRSARRRR